MLKSEDLTKDKIMRQRLPVVLSTLFFSLSGCSQDYSLVPPADSEKITVTVKLPQELKT
ncbi:hypothetical protein PS850_02269 [Pseudomonas fluorescens]|nr:hypothetical protein PS850_02269 [Pseudomonas fluorescens]